jgi:hypothetical protein
MGEKNIFQRISNWLQSGADYAAGFNAENEAGYPVFYTTSVNMVSFFRNVLEVRARN